MPMPPIARNAPHPLMDSRGISKRFRIDLAGQTGTRTEAKTVKGTSG